MKNIAILMFISTLAVGCNVNPASTSLTVQPANTAAQVAIEDFRVLEGNDWRGELEYLDYTSKQRSTIPVSVAISFPSQRALQYAVKFPGESRYNTTEKIRLSRDGSKIDGNRVVARNQATDGSVTIISVTSGEDDGQKADIRFTYFVSPSAFRITKDVRFAEGDWFNRNEYRFSR